MSFNRNDLLQGLANQQAADETPINFGMLDGAAQARPAKDLDISNKRTRMAGGQRAQQLMNDLNEKARTDNWMFTFNNPKFMRG